MKKMSMIIMVGAALCAEPTLAQFNLAGSWAQRQHEDQGERGGGPRIGDYTGLPINDAARLRADTWSPDQWTVPEHQCEPHPIDYAPLGPAAMLVTADHDPVSYNVIAWHLTFSWMNTTQTIWMDGREHPPEQAPRTWMGHSVGRWEGDILVVDISHVKEGWIRRNGVPRSDLARDHPVLDPARGHPATGDGDRRPGVPRRAVGAQRRLAGAHGLPDGSLPLFGARGDRPAARFRAALPAGHQSDAARIFGGLGHPLGSHARGPPRRCTRSTRRCSSV